MDQHFLRQAEALIPADVKMISGCEDYQTSADVSNVCNKFNLPDPAGRSGGACTSALLEVLYEHTNNTKRISRNVFRRSSASGNVANDITFQEVLMKLRSKLSSDGYTQIPQLTSSRPLDLQDTPFKFVGDERDNGRRRAVIVGINYQGQNGELSGCHNDAYNMKKYIQTVHGFQEADITMLIDDGSINYPMRSRIIQALKGLVAKSVRGDSVFFHYSGHGGLLEAEGNAFKNKNSEFDQTLIPLDYESSGQIRDFSLFNHFVQPMAAGVTVTCVMDCCHSGSVLDLPYSFRATNEGEAPRMVENIASMSNLAFLYTMAGYALPGGGIFDDISNYVSHVVGGDMLDYQGAGLQDFEAQADFDVQLDDNDAADIPEYEENLEDEENTEDDDHVEDDDHEESDNFVAEREVDDASAPVVVPGIFFPPAEEPSSAFFGGEEDDGGDEIDCCGAGCDFVESLSSLMEDMEDMEDEY